MKHFLLTLAAAALLAAPVSAQTAPSFGKVLPVSKQSTVHMLKTKKTSGENLKRIEGFTKQFIAKNLKGEKRTTRVDEESRPHQYLSYMIDGTESLTLLPTGITASDLTSASYTGFGEAQLYYADMLKRYVGNTIDAVGFYAWMGTYTNGTLFIVDPYQSTILWSADVDAIEGPATSDGNLPLNQVACDYTITGEEQALLIGWVADYSVSSADPYASQYGIILVGLDDNTGAGEGLYMMLNSANGYSIYDSYATGWQNSAGESMVFQAPILISTSGDGAIKDNDASVYSLGNVRANISTGKGNTANLTITNMGLDPISSIEYSFTSGDNTTTGTATFDEPIVFYNSASVNVAAPVSTTAGSEIGTLTVTKVNTVDDEYTADNDNVGTDQVLSMTSGYKRTPVIEEFTSTYCGYCPYGIPAMKHAADSCSNDLVRIAIHQDYSGGEDALACDDYTNMVNTYCSNYPSVVVNREYSGHASYAGQIAREMSANICEANMTVKASALTNSLTKTVTVTTNLDFLVPASEGAYGLAYVFTEDGVTGVDQLNYLRSNYENYKSYIGTYFSSEAELLEYLCGDDEDLKEVYTSGTYSNGYYWYQPTFDHVAVSATSVMGDEVLVPAVAEGGSTTIEQTLAVPTRTTPALNRSNLKVAVLLIDRTSGLVVTGRQVDLDNTESTASAINDATADNSVISVADGAFNVKGENAKAEVFTLDGKLVSSCTVNGEASIPTFGKGTFIIRVQQGTNVTTQKAAF